MKKDSGLIMLCRWVVDDYFDSTGGEGGGGRLLDGHSRL